jgi:hypothetical protein
MREIYFTIVSNKVNEEIKRMGVEVPEVVFESKYRVNVFNIIDPITDEIIKTIELTDKEVSKLPLKKRNQLKSLETTKNFNQEEFYREVERQKIVQDQYFKVREFVIEKVETSLGITKSMNSVRATISNYIDLDNLEEIEDFEIDLINSIYKP